MGSLDWSELRHYHFDFFEWYLADFDQWIMVSFTIDENGEVDGVSVPIEPAVENVIFKRKPVQLPDELLAALLGEYVTSIPGLALVVSRNEDKFYVTQTGGTAEEIKPYKLDDNLLGLKSKRVRFDFARENGTITKMIIKMPGATLEAPRKADT